MCGITGIVGRSDLSLIKKISSHLSHRGPDEMGFFDEKDISLGHRRLSIIDLKNGSQPMFNESQNVCVIFNGEIYNFRELRKKLKKRHKFKTKTDTEVLVHLYEERGIEFVKDINGIFAIALYDLRKKKFFLIRDRIGIKPIYYTISKQRSLIFSSEIRPLVENKVVKKEINVRSLKEYVQFGFVPGPKTIFKDLFKVMPGEIIVYDNEKKKILKKRYWKPSFEEKREVTTTEFIQTFKKVLKDQLVADVPLGIYLSGGLDSSVLASMVREVLPNKRIKTFSVGFDSGEVMDELYYAKKVAKKLETDHFEIKIGKDVFSKLPEVIKALDEPIDNLSALPMYFMAKEAKKKVKVILNGNGADELFGGYIQHAFFKFIFEKRSFLRKFSWIFSLLSKITKNKRIIFLKEVIFKSQNPPQAYFLFKYAEPDINLFNVNLRKRIKKSRYIEEILSRKGSWLDKLLLIDLQLTLPENYLMVDDKINMHFSIESRVPYLDHRMVKLSLSLKDSLKILFMRNKRIIRKAFRRKIPREILFRKKYGFTSPSKEWFEKNKNFIKREFFENTFFLRFFSREYLETLFDNPNNFHINLIWRLYFLSLWFRSYFFRG